MDENRKTISWVVIILMLIFFWPVGLVLLAIKLSSDKKTLMTSNRITSNVLIGCGIASLFISFGGISIVLEEGLDFLNIFLIIFFVGLGLGLIYLGQKSKQECKKYKRYIAIVVNQGERNINKIATSFNTTSDVVKKDLERMISKGIFQGAYIDIGKGEIVLATNTVKEAMSSENTTTVETRVVACPNCSATNKAIVGAVTDCEYCGSYIQG